MKKILSYENRPVPEELRYTAMDLPGMFQEPNFSLEGVIDDEEFDEYDSDEDEEDEEFEDEDELDEEE